MNKKKHNRQKSLPKQAVIPPPRKGILRWLRVLSPTGWLCASVSLALTLIGSYYLLRPQITVDPDTAIDSKTPMTTPFRVTNSGQLSLYNVRRWCHIINLHNVEGGGYHDFSFKNIGLPAIPELRPGESTSVFIPVEPLFTSPMIDGDIEVIVNYTTPIIKTTQERRFRFQTRTDINKEVRWYHKASSE